MPSPVRRGQIVHRGAPPPDLRPQTIIRHRADGTRDDGDGQGGESRPPVADVYEQAVVFYETPRTESRNPREALGARAGDGGHGAATTGLQIVRNEIRSLR